MNPTNALLPKPRILHPEPKLPTTHPNLVTDFSGLKLVTSRLYGRIIRIDVRLAVNFFSNIPTVSITRI